MYDVTVVTSPKAMDCGASCLKMLLAYYGTDVDLETLSEEVGTRVMGCTGKDVMRVARAHGLDPKAYKMDAEELILQDRPAIIWWRYYHFCVFCGLNSKGDPVIINPDRGRYAIDRGTFKSLYSEFAIFNGEPVTIPDEEPTDYEQRIAYLEDELAAAKIILGVE